LYDVHLNNCCICFIPGPCRCALHAGGHFFKIFMLSKDLAMI
jgi:hypothetical protein